MKTIISNIITVLIITAVLISIVCVCVMRAQELNATYQIDTSEYEVTEYYIRQGDTLWTLGQDLKHENDDLRAWIAAVKELNQMEDSCIKAGEIIKIYIAI